MTIENVIVNDAYAGKGGSYTYNSGTDSRAPNGYVNPLQADPVKFILKKGDTYSVAAIAKDGSGSPVNLTGHTIVAKIRDAAGNVIATPSVSVTSAAAGEYTMTVADTSAWPVTTLYSDVTYTDPQSAVASTETFQIIVQEAI
ncbi:hypothetical protein [Nitrosomonas communis]|uniref:Bacterial Ig-like domain-containing protein n=1 Tax=Nitrosomonas communis TaxID=44574 RepID=A0A1I4UV17_9PROT|nr:hypothetical protein [Nitrosomonas communis]SFM92834.1 hypothetical protein SAMN05421863_107112 [Nitrosomonas communis]